MNEDQVVRLETHGARTCAECGKMFRGAHRRCSACRATGRVCPACGKTFRGHQNTCQACRRIDHTCGECGRTFKGTNLRCSVCCRHERACEICGKTFKGTERQCDACRATDRTCGQCGNAFRGHKQRCWACSGGERTCGECGQEFKGAHHRCDACRWKSLPPDVRQARSASRKNARRARKLAAEVAGPVPPEVYEAIRASGPCVYCDAPATDVNHVRALFHGGWEHEKNLVPACGACNYSKGAKLLTEWRPDRVAHAVAVSPLVAAEYERQVTEVSAA